MKKIRKEKIKQTDKKRKKRLMLKMEELGKKLQDGEFDKKDFEHAVERAKHLHTTPRVTTGYTTDGVHSFRSLRELNQYHKQKRKEEATKRKQIEDAMKSPTSSTLRHKNPEIQSFLEDEDKLNHEENSKWAEISHGEEEWRDLDNIFAETSELVKRSGMLVQESSRSTYNEIWKSRRTVFFSVLYVASNSS